MYFSDLAYSSVPPVMKRAKQEGLTRFMKTANNLQAPAFNRLFPARLSEGNVPDINKACRIGFNASSASRAPFSRRRSERAHSILRISDNASAA
jgi:hypothetical protein